MIVTLPGEAQHCESEYNNDAPATRPYNGPLSSVNEGEHLKDCLARLRGIKCDWKLKKPQSFRLKRMTAGRTIPPRLGQWTD
jgi:hypothetical protein